MEVLLKPRDAIRCQRRHFSIEIAILTWMEQTIPTERMPLIVNDFHSTLRTWTKGLMMKFIFHAVQKSFKPVHDNKIYSERFFTNKIPQSKFEKHEKLIMRKGGERRLTRTRTKPELFSSLPWSFHFGTWLCELRRLCQHKKGIERRKEDKNKMLFLAAARRVAVAKWKLEAIQMFIWY